VPEIGVCRNEACGRHGPLQPDGYCSQACREAVAVRRQVEAIRAGMAARDAWIREQLAGLAPLAAAERLLEILQAEEAQELAEEAAAARGWRWQVALGKHPRERW